MTWDDRLRVLAAIWPLPVLILAVIGGIYGGVVAAAEAGAFGAALAYLIALAQGRMSWAILKRSAAERDGYSRTRCLTS